MGRDRGWVKPLLWVFGEVRSISIARLVARLDGGSNPSVVSPARGDDGGGRGVYADSGFTDS